MIFFNVLDQLLRHVDHCLTEEDSKCRTTNTALKWKRNVQRLYRQIKKSKKHFTKLHVYLVKSVHAEMLDKCLVNAMDRNRTPDRRHDVRRKSTKTPAKPTPAKPTKLEDIVSRGMQMEDITLERLIGTGGFGCVFQGRVGTCKVAVKKMHICTKNKLAQMESYLAELNIINLKHRNVVRTFASYQTFDGQLFILMEYAGNYNLQQVINDPISVLDSERRLRYAKEMASALKYAHDNFIVHLDVKPSNVMITPDDCCKLGDFGCCQRIVRDTGYVSPTERSYLTGTFAYRAPELLRGEVPTTRADVYSFGVTLWQMVTREQPYGGENQHVVIFGVVAYHLRPRVPTNVEYDDPFEMCYRELYTQCWANDIERRPTSKELKEVLDTWNEYFYS